MISINDERDGVWLDSSKRHSSCFVGMKASRGVQSGRACSIVALVCAPLIECNSNPGIFA